jgi:GDP-4-dehydro-6-deoxy-D-mannose reductase
VADAIKLCRPDIIVHLAGQASVATAALGAEATWEVNAVGALHLARACRLHAPEATVLFSSTGEVYGANFASGAVTEQTPAAPLSAYARSKFSAEQILADVLDRRNRLLIARAFNHSGPGQDQRFVLPSFAMQLARIEARLQEPVISVGNLEVERDFLHVDDVTQAYCDLLLRSEDMPDRCVVNVCSGVARSIKSLLEALIVHFGVSLKIQVDQNRIRTGEVLRALGDNRFLKSQAAWSPARSIEDIVAAVCSDARNQVARMIAST